MFKCDTQRNITTLMFCRYKYTLHWFSRYFEQVITNNIALTMSIKYLPWFNVVTS